MHSQIHWIESPGTGRIGVIPRPRGGDWPHAEIARLAEAGVNVLVSLLTPEEVDELELGEESRCCLACGVRFISFPITDRGMPPSTAETVRSIEQMAGELRAGKRVAIHCRMGIGRSAMIAACLLVCDNMGVDEAFEKIGQARGFAVPDTEEQREWVDRFGELRARYHGQ